MPGLVEGKVMLVTGGGSGIGRATALKLVQEGATVIIADYIQEGGERTVKMIKDGGGAAGFIQVDVSLAGQVEAMVAKTVQTYGRIDGAFSNAGIEGRMATTVETSEENFDRTIAIKGRLALHEVRNSANAEARWRFYRQYRVRRRTRGH